ncbi:MAG TPA: FHA domain-containing protein [Thermoanaerobaculales bacterium]|nr:FHA domain-containing protein [Thermoanaerobaculales bacterium]
MARLYLVYSDPEHGEQRVALSGDRSWRIGASPDNDIVIGHNDISRHHAILRIRQGSSHITDLNSKNGTFVNGRRVASATVRIGDVIHLSSTRMVIEEQGAADAASGSAGDDTSPRRPPGTAVDETQGFSGRASAEDIVPLLVTTAGAVRRGAIGEPLSWAVERFGLSALVVLYRDDDGNVSMVSSAGDLGALVRSSEALARIAREHGGRQSGTRISEISELGEKLLVAPMQRDHVLVARFEGAPPAVGDMRAVIAAVEAVLCSGNPPCPSGLAPGDRRDPELRRFGSPLHRIAGLSEVVNECKRRAAEFAGGGRPVLLAGEPGTGKALVARVIHDLSKCSGGPFVTAAALAPGPGEILVFDSDDGPSRFDQARGGTLYISDLGLVPIADQERLRELLWPAGAASLPPPAQARIVVGVVGSVAEGIARGTLHGELVSPLRASSLELPPLREHSEDIPLLVTHFQREVGGRRGGAGSGFTVAALEALTAYRWPGNVGELRAEILRLMTRAASDLVVEVADLSPRIREELAAADAPPPDLGALASRPLADARADFERWRIQRALVDAGWNQSLAAQRLGLSRAGLFKKMRKLGLAGNEGRGP